MNSFFRFLQILKILLDGFLDKMLRFKISTGNVFYTTSIYLKIRYYSETASPRPPYKVECARFSGQVFLHTKIMSTDDIDKGFRTKTKPTKKNVFSIFYKRIKSFKNLIYHELILVLCNLDFGNTVMFSGSLLNQGR